jgi:hypothetical protein
MIRLNRYRNLYGQWRPYGPTPKPGKSLKIHIPEPKFALRVIALHDGIVVEEEGFAPHPWSAQQGAKLALRIRHEITDRPGIPAYPKKTIWCACEWSRWRQMHVYHSDPDWLFDVQRWRKEQAWIDQLAAEEAKEHAARARAGKLRKVRAPTHEEVEPEKFGKGSEGWEIESETELEDGAVEPVLRFESKEGPEDLDFGDVEEPNPREIMYRWSVVQAPQSSEPRPPAWMFEFWMPKWQERARFEVQIGHHIGYHLEPIRSHLVTYYKPYAVTPRDKIVIIKHPISLAVGFKMKHGRPEIDYERHGRLQVGGASLLERDDENAARGPLVRNCLS